MTELLIALCNAVIFLGIFVGIPTAFVIAVNAPRKGPRS